MTESNRTPGLKPRKLFVFTKPAVPGRVKTRLVGRLSAEQTARLHEAFLTDVVSEMVAAGLEPVLAWALEDGEPIPAGIGGRSLPGLRQQGRDLGDRLFGVLHAGAADGSWVAAIGSDHPELGRGAVQDAFARLEAGADVVLGPTADGGYFLIALAPAAVHRRLFDDIPWSTETVRRQTVARCDELGLRVELLPMGHDVDVPADLDALIERLGRDGDSCPATRRALTELGVPAPVSTPSEMR